jgi:hypothetical protein
MSALYYFVVLCYSFQCWYCTTTFYVYTVLQVLLCIVLQISHFNHLTLKVLRCTTYISQTFRGLLRKGRGRISYICIVKKGSIDGTCAEIEGNLLMYLVIKYCSAVYHGAVTRLTSFSNRDIYGAN